LRRDVNLVVSEPSRERTSCPQRSAKINLLSLLKMHKNTRRLLHPSEDILASRKSERLVLVTTKMQRSIQSCCAAAATAATNARRTLRLHKRERRYLAIYLFKAGNEALMPVMMAPITAAFTMLSLRRKVGLGAYGAGLRAQCCAISSSARDLLDMLAKLIDRGKTQDALRHLRLDGTVAEQRIGNLVYRTGF
jgi:hypothetical protein